MQLSNQKQYLFLKIKLSQNIIMYSFFLQSSKIKTLRQIEYLLVMKSKDSVHQWGVKLALKTPWKKMKQCLLLPHLVFFNSLGASLYIQLQAQWDLIHDPYNCASCHAPPAPAESNLLWLGAPSVEDSQPSVRLKHAQGWGITATTISQPRGWGKLLGLEDFSCLDLPGTELYETLGGCHDPPTLGISCIPIAWRSCQLRSLGWLLIPN